MLLVSRELTVEVVRDPSVVLAAEPAVGFVAVYAQLGVAAAEVADAQVLYFVSGFAVVGNDDAFASLGLDELIGLISATTTFLKLASTQTLRTRRAVMTQIAAAVIKPRPIK